MTRARLRSVILSFSTLATNHLECIAATPAAGTDPSTARASRFHIDCATLPIAKAHNPLLRDLNFSGPCMNLSFIERLRDSGRRCQQSDKK